MNEYSEFVGYWIEYEGITEGIFDSMEEIDKFVEENDIRKYEIHEIYS